MIEVRQATQSEIEWLISPEETYLKDRDVVLVAVTGVPPEHKIHGHMVFRPMWYVHHFEAEGGMRAAEALVQYAWGLTAGARPTGPLGTLFGVAPDNGKMVKFISGPNTVEEKGRIFRIDRGPFPTTR